MEVKGGSELINPDKFVVGTERLKEIYKRLKKKLFLMMIKRAARGKFQIFLTFNNLAPTEIVPPPIIYEYYHHAMLSPHIIIIIFSSRKITEANSDKHLSSVKLKCSNGLKLLFAKKRAATSHASIEIYFKNFFAHLKLCFYCT